MAALTQQERTGTMEEMTERVAALEQRGTVLEAEVARLKAQQVTATPEDATPWWKKLVGVYKDDPDFEEAMRLGQEYRKAQRPLDETLSDEAQEDAV